MKIIKGNNEKGLSFNLRRGRAKGESRLVKANGG